MHSREANKTWHQSLIVFAENLDLNLFVFCKFLDWLALLCPDPITVRYSYAPHCVQVASQLRGIAKPSCIPTNFGAAN
jgi:hypothetical protein